MTAQLDSYIIFQLAGNNYGVLSSEVRHVEMLEHITPLPNATASIEGVVFSRGRVIPAMDLRRRFGLPAEPRTVRTRLLFIEVRGRLVALIVDSAREFTRIPTEAMRPIQETLVGAAANYVKAVAQLGDRLVLILDPPAVLATESIPNLGPGSFPATSLPATLSPALA